jgi:predicted DNA-binding transcriptional regulator YafY
MYDPVMRVLTVLEILQARERVTGPELARRMEVSRRTVQRYVARLQDLGIPVEGTPGVGGAYRLRPGFRLPPLMFTDEEAFALALGLRALRHVGLEAFAPAAEGAAAKLTRVLPDAVRERVGDVEEAVTLEAGRWTVATDPATVLTVAASIRARRTVRFRYMTHDGAVSERSVEPYGLVHLDGRWYLVGHCQMRRALRTFRLDRVTDVVEGDSAFERPAAFDARQFLVASLPFVKEPYDVEVWLGLSPEAAVRRLEPWRVSLEAADGGTRLRCTRDELEPFAAMLLGLGCPLRVHGPQALRDAFATLAGRASAAAR